MKANMQWIAKGSYVHALNSYKSMVTGLNRLFRLFAFTSVYGCTFMYAYIHPCVSEGDV